MFTHIYIFSLHKSNLFWLKNETECKESLEVSI